MKYFQYSEFKCKCGQCASTGEEMDKLFLQRLEALREACNFPFIISSGYRCPDYNMKVSQTGRKGAHTLGKAVDIVAQGSGAYRLLMLAFKMGFTGIGINQKGINRFVHVDTVLPNELPRPSVWSY